MKEQKNNNIGMKVISVFIAVLIWLLVANINDPVRTERFTDVPVKIINEKALTDQGYAYEVKEGSEVTIIARGKSSILRSMSESDFQVVADFSKLSKVNAIPIDVSAKKYDDQLELSLGTVNTMKISIDEIVSVSLPVEIVVKGDVADGYAVGNMTGTPNLVRVTGPENLLSSAKEIRAEVNIDGISRDITSTAKPILYDEDGKIISSNQIQMDTDSIDVSIALWKTKTVPIRLNYTGKPASGYELVSFDYEPKEITVAAPDEILESLEYITLPSVSLEDQTEDYEKDVDLTQENILPDDVVLADDTKDVKIRANIEKIVTQKLSFSSSDITVKGKGNYKVTFDSANEYVLSVDGTESRVKDISIDDFEPWIDLTDLESGEHEVNVHMKKVDGITINSTIRIKVTLKE
ncbi:MAG: CdaR family protein [Lachnospiraceae bacterium]|nr:CdaR family protein [Lachnospiraceae bacterium]